MTMQELEQALLRLPVRKRLEVAHLLLDSLVDANANGTSHGDKRNIGEDAQLSTQNPLLPWIGRYSGGPGDTSERGEEIIAAEINAKHGLGRR